MSSLTLLRREHELAAAARQREILERPAAQPPFDEALARHGLAPLRAAGIQVLQVNVGKLCNQKSGRASREAAIRPAVNPTRSPKWFC